MIYNKGINDMLRGWRLEDEWNKMVYSKWHNMLKRCYSENFHKKNPSYKGCIVCNRWLSLSNFVEDFKLIDGYDEEKFLKGELELDKDIKSNGINKEYSLENCRLVNHSENTKQANKTRDNTYLQGENSHRYGKTGAMYGRTGENNPRSIKIIQCDKQMNLIRIWYGANEIQRELGINQSDVIACCKWYECGEDLNEWYKIRKRSPLKSAGGFIWKYYNEYYKK